MRPALLAPLLLAACAPLEEPGLSRATLEAPMRLVGTEPFWGGAVTPELLTIEGADLPPESWRVGTIVAAPGTQPPSLTILAGDRGDAAVLSLDAEPCSDGMSDRTYPYTAHVSLAATGRERVELRGCAIPERLWPRARP